MIEGTPEETEHPMATKQKLTASIGKFDILATYTYTKAVLDGATDTEAKERGMVAAIMGAKARSGHAISLNDYQTDKTAAERKKKTAYPVFRGALR